MQRTDERLRGFGLLLYLHCVSFFRLDGLGKVVLSETAGGSPYHQGCVKNLSLRTSSSTNRATLKTVSWQSNQSHQESRPFFQIPRCMPIVTKVEQVNWLSTDQVIIPQCLLCVMAHKSRKFQGLTVDSKTLEITAISLNSVISESRPETGLKWLDDLVEGDVFDNLKIFAFKQKIILGMFLDLFTFDCAIFLII